MTDIFISYAREDREKASMLVKVFQDNGWSVFWDTTILTDIIQDQSTLRTDFEFAIRNIPSAIQTAQEAFRSARCVVVLWSSSSNGDSMIKGLVIEGMRLDILVPVLIENVEPSELFKEIQVAKFIEWEGDSSSNDIQNLLRLIRLKVRSNKPNDFDGSRKGEQGHQPTVKPSILKPNAQNILHAERSKSQLGTVFICYSRQDEQFVISFANELRNRKVPIWLDKWDIPPSADWDRSIDDALAACACLIIVLSPNAVKSNEVRSELRVVLNAKKPIIPVLFENCSIPRQLLHTQNIDYTKSTPNSQSKMVEVIKALSVTGIMK